MHEGSHEIKTAGKNILQREEKKEEGMKKAGRGVSNEEKGKTGYTALLEEERSNWRVEKKKEERKE